MGVGKVVDEGFVLVEDGVSVEVADKRLDGWCMGEGVLDLRVC